MISPFSISVFALSITAASARSAHEVRSTKSLGQFWAYGKNISGLPLIYADGGAFVGNVAPPHATSYTNITLAINTSDNDTIVVSPTNTSLASNWTMPRLYIDTTSGAFSDVGFTTSNVSNTTVTSTGFKKYGTQLVWVDDEGSLESKWYAQPINANVWTLQWNTDNTITGDSVAVVLKNLAPTS